MRIKTNGLALAGFVLSLVAFVLALLSGLCVFGVMLTPVWGAILGIISLLCSAEGLTMTAIARNEIITIVQFGDAYAVSGMVIGIIVCAFSVAALVLYFVRL